MVATRQAMKESAGWALEAKIPGEGIPHIILFIAENTKDIIGTPFIPLGWEPCHKCPGLDFWDFHLPYEAYLRQQQWDSEGQL